MNRAWAGCGETNTYFAGELCVGARHERRHLFMTHLHILDRAICPIDRTDDAVDAVAGIPVNAF